MTFEDLKLSEALLRAVKAEGYSSPTPIQQQAIPHALEGRDVLGVAQTGTGKTAAFALPILQRLAATKPASSAQGPIRALILTPTRELASQIGESFAVYGKHTGLTAAVIFGGVGQGAQEQTLRRGIDVLIATPGRLLDLMNQGHVTYRSLEVFVLDEADRMLDMGFIHDVKRVIAKLPQRRQTLFFSATMPPDIQRLADSILTKPARVEVTPVSTTAETVEQHLYLVEKGDKRNLLVHVLQDPAIKRVLVFTRTKNGANRVTKHLLAARITADVIHGNKSQNARERALAAFKDGHARVLVATDIAARGIDIDGITHVINFDLPNIPESYVHRIGRTGRAGARGIALSFCDMEERAYLRDIERTIRRSVPVVVEHPFKSNGVASHGSDELERSSQQQRRGQRQGPPRRGGSGASRSNPSQRSGGGRPQGHGRSREANQSRGASAPRVDSRPAGTSSPAASAPPRRTQPKWL